VNWCVLRGDVEVMVLGRSCRMTTRFLVVIVIAVVVVVVLVVAEVRGEEFPRRIL